MYCSSSSSAPGLGGWAGGWAARTPGEDVRARPAFSDPPAPPAWRPPELRGVAANAPPAAAKPGPTPDRANPMSLIEWRLATLDTGGAFLPPAPLPPAGWRYRDGRLWALRTLRPEPPWTCPCCAGNGCWDPPASGGVGTFIRRLGLADVYDDVSRGFRGRWGVPPPPPGGAWGGAAAALLPAGWPATAPVLDGVARPLPAAGTTGGDVSTAGGRGLLPPVPSPPAAGLRRTALPPLPPSPSGDAPSLTAVPAPRSPAFLSRSADPSADRPSGLALGLGRPRLSPCPLPGDLAGGTGGSEGRVVGDPDGDGGTPPPAPGDGGAGPGGPAGDATIMFLFPSASSLSLPDVSNSTGCAGFAPRRGGLSHPHPDQCRCSRPFFPFLTPAPPQNLGPFFKMTTGTTGARSGGEPSRL
mmetsp:Transcript_2305/g.5357  ORF Transcript_2305/g.5357 Transcript_2305/m.5357 type:complete len:413 (-) Transcript_2305:37-1275(-)